MSTTSTAAATKTATYNTKAPHPDAGKPYQKRMGRSGMRWFVRDATGFERMISGAKAAGMGADVPGRTTKPTAPILEEPKQSLMKSIKDLFPDMKTLKGWGKGAGDWLMGTKAGRFTKWSARKIPFIGWFMAGVDSFRAAVGGWKDDAVTWFAGITKPIIDAFFVELPERASWKVELNVHLGDD